MVTRLIQLHPEIFVSISVTTRPPRPGEIDGVHYHFVSDDQFDTLIADGALLEWAVVHGVQRYGTPLAPVMQALAAGRPALLEIDLQGARQVKASLPEARFVFLAPPSVRPEPTSPSSTDPSFPPASEPRVVRLRISRRSSAKRPALCFRPVAER